MPLVATCEFCLASPAELVASLAADPDQLVCKPCHDDPRIPTVPLEGVTRAQSEAMIRRDLESRVTDQDTAGMADFIARELSQHGITGITWADPE